ncbi:probable phosphoglycerate mutase [Candidatus Planktophila versatilis]|uniref:Probable phosphoglycerate mutase n=1 Tax=Candidatus Planktophila versatilis TaxID=1884905 RepID=A0AAC9YVT9_9ACTN|nr:histidine phosphatase family protein [Candidatus Planktophila versatilis]ASY22341.1 probable phosphoglycerate mutase [Candidatus Planktophila versatilis]
MGNQIILWRHGQTDWNVANKFQGHTDIALNAVGQFQAQHAAPMLAAIAPTMIIASDLVRAQSTAHELVKLTGLEVLTDARLRETNCGNWEGLTGDEIRKVDLDNLRQWSMGGDNPAGGIGERRSEVGARGVAAINAALAGKDNQRLVVATHGGTARTIIGTYLDLPIPFWSRIGGLSNAQWSILEESPKGWLLVEHNAGSIPEPVMGEESGGVIPDSVR